MENHGDSIAEVPAAKIVRSPTEYNTRHPLLPELKKIDFKGPKDLSIGSPITRELWEQEKPERNALTSIIIDYAFRKSWEMKLSRPPYGLLKEPNEFQNSSDEDMNPNFTRTGIHRGSLGLISRQFLFTIDKDFRDCLADIRAQQAPIKVIQSYNRLNSLLRNGFYENNIWLSKPDAVYDFTVRGINTAVDTLERSYRVIRYKFSKAYRRFPTPEEMVAIGRRSYKLIAYLAAGNIDETILATSSLRQVVKGYKIDYFNLVEEINGNPDILQLDMNLWEELKSSVSKLDENSITTGCPALVSSNAIATMTGETLTDYPNVVNGLFDWYTQTIESSMK